MLVHRVEWRRGHNVGVLFGRAGGRDCYALEDVLTCIDLQVRLDHSPRPFIDVVLPDHKVALLRGR